LSAAAAVLLLSPSVADEPSATPADRNGATPPALLDVDGNGTMLGTPGRSRAASVGRSARRAQGLDPESTADAGRSGTGPSYSVRICRRCHVAVERAADGRVRCEICGRTRGWA
jgi:hypothetical protein